MKNTIETSERKELIIIGFMTNMCVSSTVRAALDLGFWVSIDADCCTTRDLPDGNGGKIDAQTVHNATMAALTDRFAIVARNCEWH